MENVLGKLVTVFQATLCLFSHKPPNIFLLPNKPLVYISFFMQTHFETWSEIWQLISPHLFSYYFVFHVFVWVTHKYPFTRIWWISVTCSVVLQHSSDCLPFPWSLGSLNMYRVLAPSMLDEIFCKLDADCPHISF